MIQCVIFDMDGLLIDSEPFWREAAILAFKKVGIHLSHDELVQSMGMRHDEVVKYWLTKYQKQDENNQSIELDILAKVQELVEEKGSMMPGVLEALEFFKQKKIPIALASSSPLGIIQSVLETLKIKNKFKITYSAEYEEFGKPHPAVFIATANYMRVAPEDCLMFEDSLNGVIAAKAAKMKCIAIPTIDDFEKSAFAIADIKLKSLLDFNESIFNKLS